MTPAVDVEGPIAPVEPFECATAPRSRSGVARSVLAIGALALGIAAPASRRRSSTRRAWAGTFVCSLAATACLGSTGCISLEGEPFGDPEQPFPAASRARCADYELTYTATFNGDPDDGDWDPKDEDGGGGDESDAPSAYDERTALSELVNDMVAEAGLVGFVGQEGLEGSRLRIEVRREVSASILHGVGSALTLFLFPYWVTVRYEVRADLRRVDLTSLTSKADDSWCLLINPFLVVAMPFDDPAQPVWIVERLATRVLSDLVAQEERRHERD